MGLDGIIKRADGRPLGTTDEVQCVLASVFGLQLKRSLTGQQMVENLKETKMPAIVLEGMASRPAHWEALYDTDGIWIEFWARIAERIDEICVVLRGNVPNSDPIFAEPRERFGGVLTHPDLSPELLNLR